MVICCHPGDDAQSGSEFAGPVPTLVWVKLHDDQNADLQKQILHVPE